jgi:hypothetical protein
MAGKYRLLIEQPKKNQYLGTSIYTALTMDLVITSRPLDDWRLESVQTTNESIEQILFNPAILN